MPEAAIESQAPETPSNSDVSILDIQQELSAPTQPEQQTEFGEWQEGTDDAEQSSDDWYEKFSATEDQPEDPFARFDVTSLEQLDDPVKLRESAKGAFEWIGQNKDKFNEYGNLEQKAEYIGGKGNVPLAIELMGDLFRGYEPHQEAGTYVNRFLDSVKREHAETYHSMVQAAVNKEIESFNSPEWKSFLLTKWGFNPDLIEDYQRVTMTGGYQTSDDAEEDQAFLQYLPKELHETYQRLPPGVRAAKRNDPNVENVKWDLSHHRDLFVIKDQQAKEQQRIQHQQSVEIEERSTRSISEETSTIFQEYCKRGESMGLSPLESAGVAALAYLNLQNKYWESGSEYRRTFDGWYDQIKGGNRMGIENSRRGYKRVFESAYREALSKNGPRRPTAPTPGQPQGMRTPVQQNNNGARFAPASAPEGSPQANDILSIAREYGMNV